MVFVVCISSPRSHHIYICLPFSLHSHQSLFFRLKMIPTWQVKGHTLCSAFSKSHAALVLKQRPFVLKWTWHDRWITMTTLFKRNINYFLHLGTAFRPILNINRFLFRRDILKNQRMEVNSIERKRMFCDSKTTTPFSPQDYGTRCRDDSLPKIQYGGFLLHTAWHLVHV